MQSSVALGYQGATSSQGMINGDQHVCRVSMTCSCLSFLYSYVLFQPPLSHRGGHSRMYIYSTHSHTCKVTQCVEPLSFLLSQHFSSYFRKIFLPLLFLLSTSLFSLFNPSNFLFYLNLQSKKETTKQKLCLIVSVPNFLWLQRSEQLSNFFSWCPTGQKKHFTVLFNYHKYICPNN